MAGELKVHYNLTSEADGKNEIDSPTSSNRDRKKITTRNTTKNITTFPGRMNEDSECDPDDEDYVVHLAKRKPKAGAPKETKTKTLCGKTRRR